eukprot:TRINITY_DN27331_c0_g1_i2.p1 TRINITY_DN27331_c0_g1~~TRINITY_DN27331_c0_g1_i2.p1  ORF type:complete len:167 (-),score=34.97 TRINITY_DN27331_c0_g1_i2:55-555(-)
MTAPQQEQCRRQLQANEQPTRFVKAAPEGTLPPNDDHGDRQQPDRQHEQGPTSRRLHHCGRQNAYNCHRQGSAVQLLPQEDASPAIWDVLLKSTGSFKSAQRQKKPRLQIVQEQPGEGQHQQLCQCGHLQKLRVEDLLEHASRQRGKVLAPYSGFAEALQEPKIMS